MDILTSAVGSLQQQLEVVSKDGLQSTEPGYSVFIPLCSPLPQWFWPGLLTCVNQENVAKVMLLVIKETSSFHLPFLGTFMVERPEAPSKEFSDPTWEITRRGHKRPWNYVNCLSTQDRYSDFFNPGHHLTITIGRTLSKTSRTAQLNSVNPQNSEGY